MPTLIIWGAEDRIVPVRDAHVYDRLIPDSRLVVWEDTCHAPQMERPREFNALVEEFLEEKPAAARAAVSP